jgi:hypothetical protein
MQSYLLPAIARQRAEDLRRAAQHYGPTGSRNHRPVTAARNYPSWRRTYALQPMILIAALLAFH